MITYTCKNCEKSFHSNDTNACGESTCPFCGKRADEIKSELFWCENCNVPIYENICSCGCEGNPFTSDARPVFPEERLLIEILLKKPLAFINDSVWNGAGNHYFVNGKRISFSVSKLKDLDPDQIRVELAKYTSENNSVAFDAMIKKWVSANTNWYNHITDEARQYIRKKSASFLNDESCAMFVSFSGGKDSTVVSDLVRKALSKPDIIHVFGNTTLEFPETYDYIQRFKKERGITPASLRRRMNGAERKQ